MLKTESYKKGIVFSTVLNILVKAILFFNTIIIAWFFGTTIETDLFFYVFSTITLVAAFVNGMDPAVILPEGMHLQEDEGKEAAMGFYNVFALGYTLLGIFIFAVLFFGSVPVYGLVSSFKTPVLQEHKLLLMLGSILPLLIILSNYFTSVLTTLKYFTAPLIANGIAQLFSLISLFLFHSKLGIAAAFIGMVIGYLLNIVLLLYFMRTKLHWHSRVSVKHINARVKRNLVSVQLGNLATFAFNYGIIVVLSALPTGIYSAYNYCSQVLNIPNNFIVAQASAVAGIKFNELVAKKLPDEINRIFLQSQEVLLFLMIPFCILVSLYAGPIVNILYLRGGFTRDSAEKVIYFLQYLIFLAPCYTVNTFIARVMTAGKKVSQSFFFQLGFNMSALLIIILMTRYFQQQGFVAGMLIAYYMYVLVVGVVIFRYLMPFINYLAVIKKMGLFFLFNLPFLFVFYKMFGHIQSIFAVGLIYMLYFSVIILVNHFLTISNTVKEFTAVFYKNIITKFN
ncbi:MAG: hypothetical protein JST02_09535 [Bacteroidetes bacterium]|nr:hypothetical protein [Bacteroidota bacterium]